jgi:hypothetical protein
MVVGAACDLGRFLANVMFERSGLRAIRQAAKPVPTAVQLVEHRPGPDAPTTAADDHEP